MLKTIPLTKGQVALVDDEDYEYLNQWKWTTVRCGKIYYAHRRISKKIDPLRPVIKMHQQIIGKIDGLVIDHINGNGLDNRRCNLRQVTPQQNCQNKHSYMTSKYTGVSWRKDCNKWTAYIRKKGIKVHLGYFPTEEAAFAAYRMAVESLGEQVLSM